MEKVKIENFTLKSLKVLTGGGLKMVHNLSLPEDDVINNRYSDEESTIEPDDTISNLLAEFKPFLATMFNMDSFNILLKNKMFGANGAQIKQGENLIEETKKQIEIRGIHYVNWHDENRRAIKITGVFTTLSKQKLAINSENFHLSQEVYGFEEDIEKIAKQLIVEAFKYRYEGKKKQLTMALTSTPQPEKEAEKELKVV